MSSDASTLTRESLVTRRAAPVVLFLDLTCELRAASHSGLELWERYRQQLTDTLGAARSDLERGGAVSSFTGDRHFTLRIAMLHDEAGFAVILEPFVPRDPLCNVADRYALTPRECEVARLLVSGAATDEIAAGLSIARSTAIIHVKSILAKTGTRSRAAAVGRILHPDGDR